LRCLSWVNRDPVEPARTSGHHQVDARVDELDLAKLGKKTDTWTGEMPDCCAQRVTFCGMNTDRPNRLPTLLAVMTIQDAGLSLMP
jgi:hypothetical protein